MKIIIDNKIPFIDGVLEPFTDVVYKRGSDIHEIDVQDADSLIIRTRTNCNSDLLTTSSVQFIATATIGFDHIDANFCSENNIKWTNAKACNANSVLQYVFTALVEMERRHNFKLKDKSIGIVGVGSVGTKIAEYAFALGMKVLLCDPFCQHEKWLANYVTFSEIHKADIISFHTPLSKDGDAPTFHLVNSMFINSLSSTTILINTSRGEVVDGLALKTALKTNRILDAIIDVWENEPEIDLQLLDLVGIATPHIAGYSIDGKAKGTEMSIHAVAKYFDLPLLDWRVNKLPFPKPSLFELAETSTYADIFEYTYSIFEDDQKLRLSPNTFELQRETYPIRREFGAYLFQTNSIELIELLTKLKIKTISFVS